MKNVMLNTNMHYQVTVSPWGPGSDCIETQSSAKREHALKSRLRWSVETKHAHIQNYW